jgi:transposase
MATKTKDKTTGDEVIVGASASTEQAKETGVDAPALVYDKKLKKHVFQTPDGRQFNTRLKAEKHLEKLKVEN